MVGKIMQPIMFVLRTFNPMQYIPVRVLSPKINNPFQPEMNNTIMPKTINVI